MYGLHIEDEKNRVHDLQVDVEESLVAIHPYPEHAEAPGKIPDNADRHEPGDEEKNDNENGIEKDDFMEITEPFEESLSGIVHPDRKFGNDNKSEISSDAGDDPMVDDVYDERAESEVLEDSILLEMGTRKLSYRIKIQPRTVAFHRRRMIKLI